MPCDSDQDKLNIMKRIFELPSFVKKGAQPKQANWFAWNKQMNEHQLHDFYPTKMIFEDQLEGVADPDDVNYFNAGTSNDPRAQLRQIIQHGGGVRLAYKLMSSSLHENEKILYVCEKGCWDFYTDQITRVKTPRDALEHVFQMSRGGWAASPHLLATFDLALRSPMYLRIMDIPMGQSEQATKALMLSWHIVSKRAWSLSKHCCPPDSYAGIVANPAVEAAVANELRSDHMALLSLERTALVCDMAERLRNDIYFLQVPAVRVVFELFARDKYSHLSVWGRKVLLGHLKTLPDNKSVEDVHQPLRLSICLRHFGRRPAGPGNPGEGGRRPPSSTQVDAASGVRGRAGDPLQEMQKLYQTTRGPCRHGGGSVKGNMNKKLRCAAIQTVIEQSGVLEKRGVATPSSIDRAHWCAKFKKFSKRSRANRQYHRSQCHKLPKRWSRIMHPNKVWSTLSESVLQKSAAAWHWLLAFRQGKRDGSILPDVNLCSACFSKWVLPCILVVRASDNEIFASLGNSVWGALAWPVATINAELFALGNGPVTWLHVTDPRDWSVMSWTACRHSLHGVVFQRNGHNIPLIKYTLSQKKHGLHVDDFAKCVAFLGLHPDGDSPKAGRRRTHAHGGLLVSHPSSCSSP